MLGRFPGRADLRDSMDGTKLGLRQGSNCWEDREQTRLMEVKHGKDTG